MTRPSRGYAIDTTWRTLLPDLGLAPADVLRRAGLPEDLLQRPATRLTTEEYHRFWHGIETELGAPLIAIRVCERVRAESFSPLFFAALCSPNLLAAGHRIAAYKALAAPMRLDITEHHDRVEVDFTWLDAPPPPVSLVMMELLYGVALARIGTREPVHPVEIVTRRPPAQVEAYEEYLGCHVRHGPTDRVTFSAQDAHAPFLTANPAMWDTFAPALRARLTELEPPAGTAPRVRAVLLEGIPSGLVTVDDVARRLAISPRTLQRQVGAEGSTFGQILRETREELAHHYLQRTALSTEEISFLLGYDEPTSFTRAFKTWTGTTPGAVRRQPVRPARPATTSPDS